LKLLCQYKSLLIFHDRNYLNKRIQKENLKELYQSLMNLDLEIVYYTGWSIWSEMNIEKTKIQTRAKIEKYLEDGRLMVRLDNPYLFSCGEGITVETDLWVLNPKTKSVDYVLPSSKEKIIKYRNNIPKYKILNQ
jgi:hypothetical protein